MASPTTLNFHTPSFGTRRREEEEDEGMPSQAAGAGPVAQGAPQQPRTPIGGTGASDDPGYRPPPLAPTVRGVQTAVDKPTDQRSPQENFAIRQRLEVERRQAASGGAVVDPVEPLLQAEQAGSRQGDLNARYAQGLDASLTKAGLDRDGRPLAPGATTVAAGQATQPAAGAPAQSESRLQIPGTTPIGFAARNQPDGSVTAIGGKGSDQRIHAFPSYDAAQSFYRGGGAQPNTAPGSFGDRRPPTVVSAGGSGAPRQGQPAPDFDPEKGFQDVLRKVREDTDRIDSERERVGKLLDSESEDGGPPKTTAPARKEFDPQAARTTSPTTRVAMANADTEQPKAKPETDEEQERKTPGQPARTRPARVPFSSPNNATGEAWRRFTRNAIWNNMRPMENPMDRFADNAGMPRVQGESRHIQKKPVMQAFALHLPGSGGRGGYLPE